MLITIERLIMVNLKAVECFSIICESADDVFHGSLYLDGWPRIWRLKVGKEGGGRGREVNVIRT